MRYGKRTTQIRNGIQKTARPADRSRSVNHTTGGADASTSTIKDRPMAKTVSRAEAGGSSIEPRASVGDRERKAESQDWRTGDAERSAKKTARLPTAAEKRRYIRDHA